MPTRRGGFFTNGRECSGLSAEKRADRRAAAIGLIIVDDVPGGGKRDLGGMGEGHSILVGHRPPDVVTFLFRNQGWCLVYSFSFQEAVTLSSSDDADSFLLRTRG
jgi:hypothetical protein